MSKNNIYIGILVLAAIIVGAALLASMARTHETTPLPYVGLEEEISASEKEALENLTEMLEGEDTTEAIEKDLEEINIDDLEGEFDEIDKELENL